MTFLGRCLVLATVFLSFVFLAIAAATFLNSPNWGWDAKHAQKEFGQVIPSELDKRKPIISELAKVKFRALAGWAEASQALAKIEAQIPEYQLRYTTELERIHAGDAMTPAKLEAAKPWLFEKDPKTGKPFFQLGEIENSFIGYSAQMVNLLKKITKKQAEVEVVIAEEKELTERLNGKLDALGKQEKGLYALLSLEEEARKRALEELEDLRPGYFEELAVSQLLLKRQASLRARVAELATTQKETPEK